MTLSRRIIADGKMSPPRAGGPLIHCDQCPYMKTEAGGGLLLTVRAETGAIQLQAQEHLRVPTNHRELRRSGQGRIPVQFSEEGWPCKHLDLRF